MKKYIIKTHRLGLRNWIAADVKPMAALNMDKQVMEYFPSVQSKQTTTEFIKRMQNHFKTYEFCYFAIDSLDTNEFIGFIGLCHQDYESDFTPHVDIGWRLQRSAWGKGYATEGAKACLEYGFKSLGLREVYSVASVINIKSQHVMEKIGMEKISTFNHPKLLDDDRLKNCSLFKKILT